MARDYAAAIEALNTLQSNASIVEAIRKSGGSMNQFAIPEMIGWCQRLGYTPEDFNKLNIVHIAGTKGKGSTSAFISSILEQYIPRSRLTKSDTNTNSQASQPSCYPTEIGLYTSPHLRSVRERIRIGGKPLSEAAFAHFFFETWDRLETSYDAAGPSLDSTPRPTANPATDPATPTRDNPRPKPVYFRYLTLMALHTYLSLSKPPAHPINPQIPTTTFALVLETGVGGTHDSTNVVPSPLVTAITPLALDHTAILGTTLSSIAHHKSGIFKSGSPHRTVYTSPQPAEAMAVLQQRAKDADKELCVVGVHPEIESGEVQLGLEGAFQRGNASLAVACAAAWLRERGCDDPTIPRPGSRDSLPAEFRRGLQTTKWGGRCEVRSDPVVGGGRLMWYLDGGHTVESVRLAGEWFASRAADGEDEKGKPKQRRRILLFNQQTRDAPALARSLHAVLSCTLSPRSASSSSTTTTTNATASTSPNEPLFTHAIFSTNVTYAPASPSTSPTSTSTPASPSDPDPDPATKTKTKPKPSPSPKPKPKGRYKPDLLSLAHPPSSISTLTVQKDLARVWAQLELAAGRGEPLTRVVGSVGEAVDVVRDLVESGGGGGGGGGAGADGGREEEIGGETAVFVTGSLHLVGGVLEVLGAGEEEGEGE